LAAVLAVVIVSVFALRYVVDRKSTADRRAVMSIVLSVVEQRAVGLGSDTWPLIRRGAEADAVSADSEQALYTAIRQVLATLDDGGHSSAFSPGQWKQVKADVTRDAAEHQRTVPEHVRLVELPNGGSSVVVVAVPPHAAMDEQSGMTLSKGLAGELFRAAAVRPCAVVVDLRETGGGNMWPSLTALRALVDPDHMGGIVDRNDQLVASYQALAERQFSADLGEHALPLGALARTPVAILIGPRTVSASEGITTFLRARPRSTLIGQPTAGLTTSNQKFDLPDGGAVILATARLTDPAGKGYRGAIEPDVLADRPGGIDSVSRALEWAQKQPECSAVGGSSFDDQK